MINILEYHIGQLKLATIMPSLLFLVGTVFVLSLPLLLNLQLHCLL